MKVTPVDRSKPETVTVRTKQAAKASGPVMWWKRSDKKLMAQEMLSTAAWLKEQQQNRFRQASIYARMYGNLPLVNWMGSSLNKLQPNNNLPVDRPTMNVVQSCADTLVARISQSTPRPVFLTDNATYKQRNLAKQLNRFISGELYQTKAKDIALQVLRDATILGTGCIHVYETNDRRVGLERVLCVELMVDANEAFYGKPRTLYRFKLVDRSVVAAEHEDRKQIVDKAEQAYPDNSADSQQTASDQIMLVEAWRLPSSKSAKDGRHIIACTAGTLLDEAYDKDDFPFVFMHYAPRLTGFWAQGLAEQLTGTQVEINKLLVTISKSISLVGVPRVFVEDGSKVVKSHLNDQIGAIVTYRGTKPEYEVAPCVPAELYAQLQRLIDYAYQQSGVSALAATSQKPAGLNSGEAIRNYDDLQSDRFAVLNKRYNTIFIDLAYKIIDLAKDIAQRDGKYATVYPDKDGTREINLPKANLLDDPFVIQCYDTSSLPRDPAGRLQTITEMMQAGIIDLQEGRRLLNFADLEQVDKLAIAAEERILKQLDDIVESGKFSPPDSFTDLQLALKLVSQYYNLYTAAKLEESKAQMLREWQAQCLELAQLAQPPAAPAPGMQPAQPTPAPTAELMPQAV